MSRRQQFPFSVHKASNETSKISLPDTHHQHMASDTGTDSGLAGLRVQLIALAERPRSPVLKPRRVQGLKAQSSFTFLALHDEQLPHNEEPQRRHFVAKLYQECGVAREST